MSPDGKVTHSCFCSSGLLLTMFSVPFLLYPLTLKGEIFTYKCFIKNKQKTTTKKNHPKA